MVEKKIGQDTSCFCLYEERWGIVLTKLENMDKFFNNDFHELKNDVKIITEKLNNKRPTYAITFTLAFCSALITGLIILLLNK